MDTKMVERKVEYLVRWKGYPGEDSWEPAKEICQNVQGLVDAYLQVTTHSFFISQTALAPD